MHFRYHSESAQTINSSKETKKSYRQSWRSKTTAVHPGPLYNIHKFGISASQDHLHESHIRNLKKSVQLLLQVWTKTWSFYTQNPSSPEITDKKLGYLPTGILIIGWILTNENSQKNSSKKQVLPPIFDSEHAIKLEKFEWSLVWCHTPTTKEEKTKEKVHVIAMKSTEWKKKGWQERAQTTCSGNVRIVCFLLDNALPP
jgi:hypothetical protein